MAKKKKKRALTRRRAVKAPACKLEEIPDTLDLKGATGARVKLVTRGLVGDVLFKKAEYGGKVLVADGTAVDAIEFELKAERHTLKLEFVFGESTGGEGELLEDCGGGHSHGLRELRSDEPVQAVRIFGEGE